MLGIGRTTKICLRLIGCQQRLVRSIVSNPQKFKYTEEYWRKYDGLSGNWELIYKAPIDKIIGAFGTFVTFTSVVLGGSGLYYYFSGQDPNERVFLGTSDVVLAEDFNEFLIFIAAYIVLHTTVKIFISRWIIRMYKNKEKYIAVYRGHLYHQFKKHEFDVKDFKPLRMTTFVSWGESRYAIGSRKAILLEQYFKTPRHLNTMLIKGQDEE